MSIKSKFPPWVSYTETREHSLKLEEKNKDLSFNPLRISSSTLGERAGKAVWDSLLRFTGVKLSIMFMLPRFTWWELAAHRQLIQIIYILCIHLPAGPLPSYMEPPSSTCTVQLDLAILCSWVALFFRFLYRGASYSQKERESVLKHCRKACLVPDHLNRLASSLVEGLTPDQEDMSSKMEDS